MERLTQKVLEHASNFEPSFEARKHSYFFFNLLLILPAALEVLEICVKDLLFADDSAFVTINLEDIQEITNRFKAAATQFGLKINITKTELLFQPPPLENPQNPEVLVNGVVLNCSSKFTYLAGSTVTENNSSDAEIDRQQLATPTAPCTGACGPDTI